MVLVWLFRGGDKSLIPISETVDEAAAEALKAKDKAMADYRERLDAQAKKAEERLQKASVEQIKEYEEIKDKPLDELATWFDKLS